MAASRDRTRSAHIDFLDNHPIPRLPPAMPSKGVIGLLPLLVLGVLAEPLLFAPIQLISAPASFLVRGYMQIGSGVATPLTGAYYSEPVLDEAAGSVVGFRNWQVRGFYLGGNFYVLFVLFSFVK